MWDFRGRHWYLREMLCAVKTSYTGTRDNILHIKQRNMCHVCRRWASDVENLPTCRRQYCLRKISSNFYSSKVRFLYTSQGWIAKNIRDQLHLGAFVHLQQQQKSKPSQWVQHSNIYTLFAKDVHDWSFGHFINDIYSAMKFLPCLIAQYRYSLWPRRTHNNQVPHI